MDANISIKGNKNSHTDVGGKMSNSEILSLNIEDLGLSRFACSNLKHSGFNTVGDLYNRPKEDGMMRPRTLGRKALEELLEKIHQLGWTDD